MLPKNNKHFIRPTANELDCDPILVDDVVSFFYSEVKKALIEMRGPNIQVENLGSFKAKRNEVQKLLIKYNKHLKVLNPDSFNQMITKKQIEEKLGKSERLIEQMNEESKRRKEFFKSKNESNK